MFPMPTEKPKIILVMEDTLLTRIDDYRFENRINSRSEAIRQLIEAGLEKNKKHNKQEKKQKY
jgi:metal-responsive CopG/Arc/MetJ family transcriptional regulator